MPELSDIKGVSEARADKLREEDFTTVDDVANATESDLTEVSGVGDATAPDLIQEARDVIRGTVDDTEEEEEVNTDAAADDEPEEEDDEEFPDLDSTTEDDVTVEDLEDLNGEETEGEPDDEPTVEDDEGDPENVDVTPEGHDLPIVLETDEQYDYTLYALIDMRLGRINVTHEQDGIAIQLLDEVRPLGGAGEVTLEDVNRAELNALHALLTQTATAYQGESAVEAFNAVRAVKEQVQAAREEHVL